MHKRMRRGKEMYPSFDTRRVLCKQHRPYCVKPFGAYLSHLAAFNAEAQSLRNMAGNIARNAAKKTEEKGKGLQCKNDGRFSQMSKGLKAGHIGRKITNASYKNNALGTRQITSHRPPYAPARFATNNTYRAHLAARFARQYAEEKRTAGCLAPSTTQRPRKGESKSANTEVETLKGSRLIVVVSKHYLTTELCRRFGQESQP